MGGGPCGGFSHPRRLRVPRDRAHPRRRRSPCHPSALVRPRPANRRPRPHRRARTPQAPQSLAPTRYGGLPTRPRLVLFSVAWLLAAIVRRDFSVAFDVLSRALWGPSGSEDTGLWRYPLGLDDPQQYVRTWVETIRSIATHALDILRGVRAVRLLGLGILRVCFDDERDERTLVAYCHACATRPLLLGRDPDCGCSERRLRCACGGCKPGCDRDQGDWRYWLNRSGNSGDGSV